MSAVSPPTARQLRAVSAFASVTAGGVGFLLAAVMLAPVAVLVHRAAGLDAAWISALLWIGSTAVVGAACTALGNVRGKHGWKAAVTFYEGLPFALTGWREALGYDARGDQQGPAVEVELTLALTFSPKIFNLELVREMLRAGKLIAEGEQPGARRAVLCGHTLTRDALELRVRLPSHNRRVHLWLQGALEEVLVPLHHQQLIAQAQVTLAPARARAP